MILRDAYIVKGAEGEHRNTNDYYPTPPIGTLTLLKNHPVPKRLWEPAAGRGHIAHELVRNGHEVIATDLFPYDNPLVSIETGVDFLTAGRKDVDGVITNPPFKSNLPEKFIRRMIEVHKYPFVAVFCRLTFMESIGRYDLFTDHPPARIYVLSGRVNCHEDYFNENNGIGGMVAYAWFVWDEAFKLTKGLTKWVRPTDYVEYL